MNFLAKNRALLSASMGLIFTVGGLYLFGWSLLVVQVFLLVDFLGMLLLDLLKSNKFRQFALEQRQGYKLIPPVLLSLIAVAAMLIYTWQHVAYPFNGFSELWEQLNKDMGNEMLLFPIFLFLPYMEYKMDFLMFSRHRKMDGNTWNQKRLLFAGSSYLSLLLFSFLSPNSAAEIALILVALIKFAMDVFGIQWEEKQRA